MMRMALLAFLVALAAGGTLSAQYGQQPQVSPGARETPAPLRDVTIAQRLDSVVPLDLPFCDESGRAVRLGDFFQGKPVVLVLAYYRCPMLCTQVLNGLADALRGQTLRLSEDFRIVTVSFDARDTPAAAAAKKASYVDTVAGYGQPGAAEGWHFLTGKQAAIDRLTEAVGFGYRYDAKTDQFAHASGVMVLTPQGKLARYFYGIKYHPRDLRLGLVEASEGRVGSPVDQVLLFCYHYDAASGTYAAAVRRLIRGAGALTVIVLVGGIFWALRREARKAACGLAAGTAKPQAVDHPPSVG